MSYYGMAQCLIAVWNVRRAREILFPGQTRKAKMVRAFHRKGGAMRKRDWVKQRLDAGGIRVTFCDIAHDLSAVYYFSLRVLVHDVLKLFAQYMEVFPEYKDAIMEAKLAFHRAVATEYPDINVSNLKGLPHEFSCPPDYLTLRPHQFLEVHNNANRLLHAICPMLFPFTRHVAYIPPPDYEIDEDHYETASTFSDPGFTPKEILKRRRCSTPELPRTRYGVRKMIEAKNAQGMAKKFKKEEKPK